MKKEGLFFNENLKKMRLNKNLKQSELGEILGVKQNMISSYENGTRSPSIKVAKKAVDFFGVNYEDLLVIDTETARELLSSMDEVKDLSEMTLTEIADKYDLSDITEEELENLILLLKAQRQLRGAQ